MKIFRMIGMTLCLSGLCGSCITDHDTSTSAVPSEEVDSVADINEDMLIIDSTGHTAPEDSINVRDSVHQGH